uniref:Uncharacterized protein n=1 Tax=Amphimedon queenslandica TaxID=400682 RepID=A0A1X7TDB4_AMPQE
MDLDSLDAPMFVDVDMIKRGEEEGEGDEWFDKKIDDDDDTFTNTSSSLTDKESKLTQLASPAQLVAREQPHVARD